MDERNDGAKTPAESEPAVKAVAQHQAAAIVSPPLVPAMEPMRDAVAIAADPAGDTGPAARVGSVFAAALRTRVADAGAVLIKGIVPVFATTVAIAGGIVAGSLLTGHLAAESRGATTQQVAALQSRIAQLESELGTIRTSMDAKATGGQLAKIAERIDRAERAQAEPAAKLAKLSETVERLEKADVTGAIAPDAKPAQPPIIQGWSVRDVYDGVAVVQSRYGLIEVERGDALPGLGRVEAIRKQDGRWLVVTPKGLIVQR
jgi:hypothetical protein